MLRVALGLPSSLSSTCARRCESLRPLRFPLGFEAETERRKDSKEVGWVVDRTVKRAMLEDPWQDPAVLRTLNQMQRAEDMPIARYTPSSTAADEDQTSLHDDSFLPFSTTLLLSSRTRSSPLPLVSLAFITT